jgi:hypothetical protein
MFGGAISMPVDPNAPPKMKNEWMGKTATELIRKVRKIEIREVDGQNSDGIDKEGEDDFEIE